MSKYDNWLLNQAEEHTKSCEPTVVMSELEYEGRDEYGNIEYSQNNYMNCEECTCCDCEYWADYHNQDEYNKLQKEIA